MLFRGGDGSLQILTLFATLGALLGQCCELLSGVWKLASLDIQLAQIFVRSLVIGVEVQRLLIEGKRGRVVARLAQAETHQCIDVRVLMRVSYRPELHQRGLI